MAEDTELIYRIYLAGHKVRYVGDAEFYEEAVETWNLIESKDTGGLRPYAVLLRALGMHLRLGNTLLIVYIEKGEETDQELAEKNSHNHCSFTEPRGLKLFSFKNNFAFFHCSRARSMLP